MIFKELLFILGIVVVFRIIGKIMTARRRVNEHHSLRKEQQQKARSEANIGKTSISKIDRKNLKDQDFSSYEEID